ncbi:MAG: hypothetical protein AAGI44_15225 [Pseudomonadota bacterium]
MKKIKSSVSAWRDARKHSRAEKRKKRLAARRDRLTGAWKSKVRSAKAGTSRRERREAALETRMSLSTFSHGMHGART